MNALSLFPSWFLFAFGGTLVFVGDSNGSLGLFLLGFVVLLCGVLSSFHLFHLSWRRSLDQAPSRMQTRSLGVFMVGLGLLVFAAYFYGPAARHSHQGLRTLLAGQYVFGGTANAPFPGLPTLWLSWLASAPMIAFGVYHFSEHRLRTAALAAVGVLGLYPVISLVGHTVTNWLRVTGHR